MKIITRSGKEYVIRLSQNLSNPRLVKSKLIICVKDRDIKESLSKILLKAPSTVLLCISPEGSDYFTVLMRGDAQAYIIPVVLDKEEKDILATRFCEINIDIHKNVC